jgi:hypothetical protein
MPRRRPAKAPPPAANIEVLPKKSWGYGQDRKWPHISGLASGRRRKSRRLAVPAATDLEADVLRPVVAVSRDTQLLPIPAIGKPSSSRERQLAEVVANSHYRPTGAVHGTPAEIRHSPLKTTRRRGPRAAKQRKGAAEESFRVAEVPQMPHTCSARYAPRGWRRPEVMFDRLHTLIETPHLQAPAGISQRTAREMRCPRRRGE